MNKELDKCTKRVQIFDKKWKMPLLLAIGNSQKIRYSELMQELYCINPKSLSDTLKDLELTGIITKRFYNEIPPHTEYSLSVIGLELYHALGPILKWLLEKQNMMKIEQTELGIMKKALASIYFNSDLDKKPGFF